MRESTPAGYEKWGGLALDARQKAADLDPNDSDPRYARTYAHLSRIDLRAGNREMALQTLRDGVAPSRRTRSSPASSTC